MVQIQVRQHSPHRYSQTHAQEQHARSAMMLCSKQPHRLIKDACAIDGTPASTFSLVMDDLSRVNVCDLPAGGIQPIAKIEVLTVHEECWIKSADVLECFTANQHKRATDRIDVVGFILVAKRL